MTTIPEQMQAVTTCNWPKTTRLINLVRHRQIISIGNGVAALQTVPVPRPKEHQLLVCVTSVAINPTDWKHVDFIAPAGARIGCDFVGVVEKVTKTNPRNFSVGDRVAGAVHGGLYQHSGSFAEYLAADEELVEKIPENLNNAEAATLGVSLITAMQALNIYLGLPYPGEAQKGNKEDNVIMIYSGATGAGLMTLQLAKLAGWTTITTCSPHSSDVVKEFGADVVYDYRSSTAAEEIRKAYPNLKFAVDCFSAAGSLEFCSKVLTGREGAEVISLIPGRKSIDPTVKVTPILAYTLTGEPFQWFAPFGPKIPAYPEHKKAAAKFTNMLPDLLKDGSIKPLPTQKLDGGLSAVFDGFDMMRHNKVSGKKLIIEL